LEDRPDPISADDLLVTGTLAEHGIGHSVVRLVIVPKPDIGAPESLLPRLLLHERDELIAELSERGLEILGPVAMLGRLSDESRRPMLQPDTGEAFFSVLPAVAAASDRRDVEVFFGHVVRPAVAAFDSRFRLHIVSDIITSAR